MSVNLSVVIPVFRSQAVLPELHRRLIAALEPLELSFEILLIEDCGGDDSWRVIQDLAMQDNRIHGLRLARNYGQHNALLCGIRAAKGEMIVTIGEDVLDAAGTAFRNERFHCDPRLSPELSDLRYQNWVRSSLAHPRQRLYVLRDDQTLIAFFVIENLDDGTIYWHLNAVTPAAQGKGYGRRAWQAMIGQAKKAGAQCVRSSIAARNHRVLNLYARLGFYFPPPLMTFHWVHSA